MDNTLHEAMATANQQAQGGMRLPQHRGVGTTVKQAVHDHWDTMADMEEALAQKGLEAPAIPSYGYPGSITAEDLTTQDSKQYSTLYAQHLGWYTFTATVVARIRAYLVQVDNEMGDILSRLRKAERERNPTRRKEDRLSTADIQDVVEQDVRYRELKLIQQKYTQQKLLTEAQLDGMELNLKVISRQVEIRRAEFERTQGGSNLANRGNTQLRV